MEHKSYMENEEIKLNKHIFYNIARSITNISLI